MTHLEMARMYADRAPIPDEYRETVEHSIFLALSELSSEHCRLLEREARAWGDEAVRRIILRVEKLLKAQTGETTRVNRQMRQRKWRNGVMSPPLD